MTLSYSDMIAAEEALKAAESFFKPNKKTLKRRLQRKRKKEREKMPEYPNMYNPWMIKLATVNNVCQSVPEKAPEVKKENPMYVDYVSNDKHTESAKTNYLLTRMENVKYKLQTNLRKQFALDDDNAPTTPQELVDRITSGKFVLPTEKELEIMRAQESYNWPYSGSVISKITWRDPASKEDKDGWKIASTELEVEVQKTHDAVMLLSNDTALSAIQALENWKPTGKAN